VVRARALGSPRRQPIPLANGRALHTNRPKVRTQFETATPGRQTASPSTVWTVPFRKKLSTAFRAEHRRLTAGKKTPADCSPFRHRDKDVAPSGRAERRADCRPTANVQDPAAPASNSLRATDAEYRRRLQHACSAISTLSHRPSFALQSLDRRQIPQTHPRQDRGSEDSEPANETTEENPPPSHCQLRGDSPQGRRGGDE
jgi:hypothetical protein